MLILCTDGGVLYFETHPTEATATIDSTTTSEGATVKVVNKVNQSTTNANTLLSSENGGIYGVSSGIVSEIESLQYNSDTNKAWCLKRIPLTCNNHGSDSNNTVVDMNNDFNSSVLFLQAIKLNESNKSGSGSSGYEIKITSLQGLDSYLYLYIYCIYFNLLLTIYYIYMSLISDYSNSFLCISL